MRHKLGDRQRLGHILKAIDAINIFASGLPARIFFENELIRSGTVYQLQIIGEATSRLTEETKADNPAIDWQGIIGLRNLIVHEYWGVDFVQVWSIVKVELPGLRETVQALLAHFPNENNDHHATDE